MKRSKYWVPAGILLLVSFLSITFVAQDPVIFKAVDIDQATLLTGTCKDATASCGYKLVDVLNSGGHFWTTPFQPASDGYGEGDKGPRADQRHYFNPTNSSYHFLRMNGLDSQSCFECHNSIGSYQVDSRGALMRKPYPAGGAAGSNSNAFINPYYPTPETLFIRNPPAVFGSGYVQSLAEEMTDDLAAIRLRARADAASSPDHKITKSLVSKGIDFGTFSTTYHHGSAASVEVDAKTCPAGTGTTPQQKAKAAVDIGGAPDFDEDLRNIEGISCDLVVRPFQWKGVAAGLRHFVRDALDFHFSMQAFEKVGLCDCDRDGKGKSLKPGPDRTEVTIGEVTAMASFVAMTRPPVQESLSPSAKLGKAIFFNENPDHTRPISGLPKKFVNMCAACHVDPLHLNRQEVRIEWPINPVSNAVPSYIDPDVPASWAITPNECPKGENPTSKPVASCPTEMLTLAEMSDPAVYQRNPATLISPLVSSARLAVVRRYTLNRALLKTNAIGFNEMSNAAEMFQAAQVLGQSLVAKGGTTVGNDYVIPLNVADRYVTPLQLPRLKGENADGSIDVPLFSDLKRHNMGKCLSDPVKFTDSKGNSHDLPPQGTDVLNIFNNPQDYLTRPLWGVADTGPWLHDGRALTLTDAVLMHGDSIGCGDSEAAPVVDAFKNLKDPEKQGLIDFLLTLRLPLPQGVQVASGP